MRYLIFFSGILLALNKVIAGIDFSIGDQFRVLSDRGYRYSSENKFIAEGNVIIISDENTLYGKRANIFLNDQKFVIENDVKLVNPNFSLLGEYFHYFNKEKRIQLINAIILTDNYKVVGESASRVGDGDIVLSNAKYTTCKDCPDSWSFKGEKIWVTPGEYVRIKGAYFVVNGVSVLYIPYFFFPIKKERESGVLFPRLTVNLNDGTFLQLPYFQTLGDHADVTFIPTLWGNWGIGGEAELRRAFGNKNFFKINSKIVKEYDENGRGIHVTDFDFSFWSEDERLKFHTKFNLSNNFDSLIRFERYIDQTYSRPDFGGEIKMGYTGDNAELSVNISSRHNLLSSYNQGQDKSYVQTLPEISLDFVSEEILHVEKLFKVFTVGSIDYTQFRQLKLFQEIFSRNADRFQINNRLNIFYNSQFFIGKIKSSHDIRLSKYSFRRTNRKEKFDRAEVFHYLNWEIPLEKDILNFSTVSKSGSQAKDIGSSERLETYVDNEQESLFTTSQSSSNDKLVVNTSYTHRMNVNFNFYHLGNIDQSGDISIRNQLENDNFSPNTQGLFDYRDSALTFENQVRATSTLSSLQRTNTVEFLLSNNFFKEVQRSFKNMDKNSERTYIGSFLVSQGFLIKNRFVPETRLSRLLFNANTRYSGWQLGFSDSYFHDTQEHLLNFNISKHFSLFALNSQLIYDSRTVPYNKVINSRFLFKLNPEMNYSYRFSYDIAAESQNFEEHLVRYLPRNDCWFLEFNYFSDQIQSRYSVNFMLNLNEKQFKENARL